MGVTCEHRLLRVCACGSSSGVHVCVALRQMDVSEFTPFAGCMCGLQVCGGAWIHGGVDVGWQRGSIFDDYVNDVLPAGRQRHCGALQLRLRER